MENGETGVAIYLCRSCGWEGHADKLIIDRGPNPDAKLVWHRCPACLGDSFQVCQEGGGFLFMQDGPGHEIC